MEDLGTAAETSGPATFFVWVFAIIDAVRQAKAINSGLIDTGGLASSERVALSRPRESMAGLTWGVILVGLGVDLFQISRLDRIFLAGPCVPPREGKSTESNNEANGKLHRQRLQTEFD